MSHPFLHINSRNSIRSTYPVQSSGDKVIMPGVGISGFGPVGKSQGIQIDSANTITSANRAIYKICSTTSYLCTHIPKPYPLRFKSSIPSSYWQIRRPRPRLYSKAERLNGAKWRTSGILHRDSLDQLTLSRFEGYIKSIDGQFHPVLPTLSILIIIYTQFTPLRLLNPSPSSYLKA